MKGKKKAVRIALMISKEAHAVLKAKAEAEGRTMKKVLDMLCGV